MTLAQHRQQVLLSYSQQQDYYRAIHEWRCGSPPQWLHFPRGYCQWCENKLLRASATLYNTCTHRDLTVGLYCLSYWWDQRKLSDTPGSWQQEKQQLYTSLRQIRQQAHYHALGCYLAKLGTMEASLGDLAPTYAQKKGLLAGQCIRFLTFHQTTPLPFSKLSIKVLTTNRAECQELLSLSSSQIIQLWPWLTESQIHLLAQQYPGHLRRRWEP